MAKPVFFKREIVVWLLPSIPLLLVIFGVWFWFLTVGTGRLFVEDSFSQYYDGMARSLKHGRLDVDERYISGEAFILNGKYYGYFGPVPALPRIVLTSIAPPLEAKWSRFSLLIAALAHLAAILGLLRHFQLRLSSWFVQLLLASLTIGSTMLLLVSWSAVYHEAILWSSALALASCYCALRYLRERRLLWLGLACGAAVCSFFTRVPAGAGAMLALAYLFVDPVAEVRLRSRVLIAACLACCIGLFITMNWVRFGTILESIPYKLFVQMTPERLARTQGTLVHPEVFLFQLGEIFLPVGLEPRLSFPWVKWKPVLPMSAWPKHYDYMEAHAGLLLVEPGLLVLSVLGLLVGARGDPQRRRIVAVVASLVTPVLILSCFGAMIHRYLQDSFPLLAVGSIMGATVLVSFPPGWKKTTLTTVAAVLLAWSIPLHAAFVLRYQREDRNVSDEAAHRAFRQLRGRVDRLIAWRDLKPVPWLPGKAIPIVVAGQMVEDDLGNGVVARYRFDGYNWQHVSGPDVQQVILRINLAGVPDGSYTLLSSGKAGASNVFFLEWRAGKARISMDHWSMSPTSGEWFPTDVREHTLVFVLDRLNEAVTVNWDGSEVYRRDLAPHPFREASILVGHSAAPSVHPAPFSGAITRVK